MRFVMRVICRLRRRRRCRRCGQAVHPVALNPYVRTMVRIGVDPIPADAAATCLGCGAELRALVVAGAKSG